MTIPSGPIVGGKFSLVGILLFVGFGVALFYLCTKLFKQEVVLTDAATGTAVKVGTVTSSFENPFKGNPFKKKPAAPPSPTNPVA